jgi:shikimate kinase
VACGGGLVIQPGLLEALQGRGVVVCLHASIGTILERAMRQRNRPLLEVGDPAERVRTLYAQREAIYRAAGTLVLTDARPLRDVVAHVIRVWQREAEEFARWKAAPKP